MSKGSWILTIALLAVAVAMVTAACGDERAMTTFARATPRSGAELSRAVLADLPAAPRDGLTREVPLEDPSGHALDRFRDALDRAAHGERVARIVAYGGSHTASDHWTGALRSRLQAQFGDAGHGFVLPVPPITSYWQRGVRIEDAEGWTVLSPSSKRPDVERYGIAGIAFEAHEPAWAEIATDGSTASRIEVMFLRQPGGGALEVVIDGTAHTISTAGEREEAATAVFAVPDGAHRVRLRTRDAAPVRIYGAVMEREVRSGVVVDQLGLAGAKARHQLHWDEEVWSPLIRTRAPDLLLLSYGNNETDDRHLQHDQHEAHFVAMIERLQRTFPEASCVVVGPSDRNYPGPEATWKTPSLLAWLVDMQRRVALARGCAFFDTLAWQGGTGAVDRWLTADPPLERDDRIHFSEQGYRRLGEALLRALLAEGPDRASVAER